MGVTIVFLGGFLVNILAFSIWVEKLK